MVTRLWREVEVVGYICMTWRGEFNGNAAFFFGIFIRYEVIEQFLLLLAKLHAFQVSSFKGFFVDF